MAEDSDAVESKVIPKKWMARLVDRHGKLVRQIPIPWSTPPALVPGFMEFELGVMQIAAPTVLRPLKRYDRIKLVRSDERLTIVEYRQVLLYGRG